MTSLSQELQNNVVAQESLFVSLNFRLGYRTKFMKKTKTHRPEYIYVGFNSSESAKSAQEKYGGMIRTAKRLSECKLELVIKTKDYELINELESKLIKKNAPESEVKQPQQKEAPMTLKIVEQTLTQFVVTAVDVVTVTEDKPKPYHKYRWTFKSLSEAESFLETFYLMNGQPQA